MPRKVTPRWGETGVMKVPSFTLDEEDLDEIGSALGISGGEALSQLKPRLEEIATRYLLWIQQDERGPSQAERNAALKRVLASPQELERNLAQLDYATQGELLDKLWVRLQARGGKLALLDKITRDDPKLVIDCAKRLLAKGQKRRGPGSRKTLPIIIRWLASIYEETTGFKFTHTPYHRCEYTSVPQSQAGHFVITFLRMVDPNLPNIPTAITTEMARFVAAREQRVKDSRCEVQTI
jgi:hypothetical protein